MKKRIDYIDVAKALLIFCLIIGHYMLHSNMQGVEDVSFAYARPYIKLYATFFMQTFFIISGLCSSFNTPFTQYLWKNSKTILIPGIVLTIINRYIYNALPGNGFEHTPTFIEWFVDGGPWFIFAMFEAKILFWLIVKLNKYMQMLFLFILYISVLCVNSMFEIPNYVFFKHALLMLPYLYAGYMLKSKLSTVEILLPYLAAGGAMVLGAEFVLNLPMPVHDYYVGVTYKTFPIHIVNVFAGTFVVLFISKKIKNVEFLKIIGKGTLLIYLMNECTIKSIVIVGKYFRPIEDFLFNTLYHLFIYALIMILFYVMVKIVYSNKYLCWIVGKY